MAWNSVAQLGISGQTGPYSLDRTICREDIGDATPACFQLAPTCDCLEGKGKVIFSVSPPTFVIHPPTLSSIITAESNLPNMLFRHVIFFALATTAMGGKHLAVSIS